jgi:hypothetical protein
MKPSFDEMVEKSASVMPEAAVDELFRLWVGPLHVALCLHRVNFGPRRPNERFAELSIDAGQLDVFIERALSTRLHASDKWLVVSFDDGYEDAARYVRTRHRRFPQVEWLFFVCPEKLEKQAGFRWDWQEAALARGESITREGLVGPVDLATENDRPELQAVAREEAWKLVSVEACREVGKLPGVALGNHTNVHCNPLTMTLEQAREEYSRAHRDFERLFGPYAHFAFPFGSPEVEFSQPQVDMVRGLAGRSLIWSTEARPYAPEERQPGAVLPRFPVDGRKDANTLLLWVAARSLRFRLRGSRFRYPLTASPVAA